MNVLLLKPVGGIHKLVGGNVLGANLKLARRSCFLEGSSKAFEKAAARLVRRQQGGCREGNGKVVENAAAKSVRVQQQGFYDCSCRVLRKQQK